MRNAVLEGAVKRGFVPEFWARFFRCAKMFCNHSPQNRYGCAKLENRKESRAVSLESMSFGADGLCSVNGHGLS